MKVYVVMDNDDYGSLMSPSCDEIDSIFLSKAKAELKVAKLNGAKKQYRTKAYLKEYEAID